MMRLKRWALVSVLVLGIASAATAQPTLPKKHPKITPTFSSALCYRCHERARMPTPERTSFCGTCHLNTHYETMADVEGVRFGPRPRHPVAADWQSALCFLCHKPHKMKAARHPVVPAQPSNSFCLPCHETPTQRATQDTAKKKGITGEERVGDFCMPCHNMGLKAQHPGVPEGAEAKLCFTCHKSQ